MNVLLKTIDNFQSHSPSLMLKTGQVAIIGRSEKADLAFPNEMTMHDPHFEIRVSRTGCFARTLSSADFLVNGEATKEMELNPQDVLSVGNTRIQVIFEAVAKYESEPMPAAVPEEIRKVIDWIAICKLLELPASVKELSEGHESVGQLSDTIRAKKDYKSAILLRAFDLGSKHAVRWACRCCRELHADLPSVQSQALVAAEAWCIEPTEPLARAAERAAVAAEHQGAEGLTAWAAFCASENIGPEGYEPVAPTPDLVFKFVAVALMLLAFEFENNSEQMELFLDIGSSMADEQKS